MLVRVYYPDIHLLPRTTVCQFISKISFFFRSIKERRNAYFGVASARGKNWNILLALFQNKWFRGFYIKTTHFISIIFVRFFPEHGQLLQSLHSYQSLLLYLFLNWSRLFHEIFSYYFFWIALFLSICLLLSSSYLFFCCLSRPVCQEYRLTVLFCFCLSFLFCHRSLLR